MHPNTSFALRKSAIDFNVPQNPAQPPDSPATTITNLAGGPKALQKAKNNRRRPLMLNQQVASEDSYAKKEQRHELAVQDMVKECHAKYLTEAKAKRVRIASPGKYADDSAKQKFGNMPSPQQMRQNLQREFKSQKQEIIAELAHASQPMESMLSVTDMKMKQVSNQTPNRFQEYVDNFSSVGDYLKMYGIS